MGDDKKNDTWIYKHDLSDPTRHLAMAVANILVI